MKILIAKLQVKGRRNEFILIGALMLQTNIKQNILLWESNSSIILWYGICVCRMCRHSLQYYYIVRRRKPIRFEYLIGLCFGSPLSLGLQCQHCNVSDPLQIVHLTSDTNFRRCRIHWRQFQSCYFQPYKKQWPALNGYTRISKTKSM